MEHTLSIKTSRLVFVARLTQIILGTVSIPLAGFLFAYANGDWAYTYDNNYQYILIPSIALSCITTLVGGIGMFAYKRPNDVHWHLMLSLDWLAFALSAANVGLCGYVTSTMLPFSPILVAVVSACFLASMVPVIRTHRLKKRGMLPPRNSPKEDWYYIEEQQSPSPRSYPSYVAPTQPQTNSRRLHSQAISRSGTTARWSGASGTETMLGTVKSDEDVPPYSGLMSPAASVVYPKH